MRTSRRPCRADRAPPLPERRREELLRTLAEAEALAGGAPPAGLDHLCAGLERAEEALRAGEPCGEALVRTYQFLIDWYKERHRLDG